MVNQGKTEIPGQNTVVSSATCIRGHVTGDSDLVVHGRIEGQIQTSQGLFIEPTGVVKADVSAGVVVIQGTLVGNVIAAQSVQITAEGRVVGNISTPRFSMAEGALYRGHVETDEEVISQMLSAGEARMTAQPAARAAYQRPSQAASVSPAQPSRRASSSASRTSIPAPPPAARVSFKPVESKVPRSAAHLPQPPAPPPPPPPFQALLLRDEDLAGGMSGDDDGTPDPVLIGKRKGALRRKK